MQKTIKYLIIFIALASGFFFLLTGIFGSRGVLDNRALKSQLRVVEYEEDKLNMELESLENQRDSLSTEEGLRNAAINLGYYVEGDEVYRFATPALQESVTIPVTTPTAIEYTPLKPILCFLIATAAAALAVLVVAIIDSRRNSFNDFEQSKPGNNSDTFYIDG